MKNSIYYYSIVSIFLFLSCTGWKDKRNMESDIITANLERRDNVSTKELFSDIQVIPLETTPESLIRDITQIKFFEGRYYIHDYRRSQIFVFDREGRFQFALNEKGDGPGQYLNLSDFAIDTDTVIMALGTSPNPLISNTTKGLEINRWRCIVADESNGKTTKEGVYAGGDAVTGAATVILAMEAGRAGARGIDEYLSAK